jgi:hypothetical protein
LQCPAVRCFVSYYLQFGYPAINILSRNIRCHGQKYDILTLRGKVVVNALSPCPCVMKKVGVTETVFLLSNIKIPPYETNHFKTGGGLVVKVPASYSACPIRVTNMFLHMTPGRNLYKLQELVAQLSVNKYI